MLPTLPESSLAATNHNNTLQNKTTLDRNTRKHKTNYVIKLKTKVVEREGWYSADLDADSAMRTEIMTPSQRATGRNILLGGICTTNGGGVQLLLQMVMSRVSNKIWRRSWEFGSSDLSARHPGPHTNNDLGVAGTDLYNQENPIWDSNHMPLLH